MNILEQYIEAIYSEDIVHYNDWFGAPADLVRVDIMTDCYGSQRRVQTTFMLDEWERIKKDGYYME
jgi:hypothetical protein